MNKLKIMLTAMIVLGTVGGVLAFKAKRSSFYCTRSTVNGVCPTNATCPNYFEGNQNGSAAIRCFVATAEDANCAVDNPSCSSTARLAAE